MLKYINLQLFADGEINEENANLNNDVGNENQNEVGGDTQPDLSNDTSQNQSKDKDNPANHAFAEMRRELKQLKAENQKLTQQQKEKDNYYSNLAKQAGRTDIQTEEQYRKAVKLENLSNQYKETGDPLIMAEIMKETMQTIQPVRQETYIDNGLDKEIEDFNKEFKGNLKTVADIATLPNYQEIVGYMENNNLPLSKAYALANPEKIQAANRQAAINQAKGFTHVKSNSNGGNVDSVHVSADEINTWKRRHGSGKTDEQCRKEIIEAKQLFVD